MIILWMCAACQTAPASPSPPPSSPTPRPALLMPTTLPARALPLTPTATLHVSESAVRASPGEMLIAPGDLVMPTRDASGVVGQSIGISYEGRSIDVYRFGAGDRVVLLVGGLHGGYEANTVVLMRRMIAHFQAHATAIPPGAALWIIPVANPDGLVRGTGGNARFNVRGVDLNRNWSCDWRSEAWWRSARVNAGAIALSEPETRALANFIIGARPFAALFYHSAANGIFPGNCRGDHGSLAMASVYSAASGYPCCAAFTAYPVTGTAASWADGERIPAADVELASRDQPEFDANLSGVLALLTWAAGG